MEELLEQAWNLTGLPGSSDRYIMHVCALMSNKEWAELAELLRTPAEGIPSLWRSAMLRHCQAEIAAKKLLNPAAAPFVPKSSQSAVRYSGDKGHPEGVRYAAGPPLDGSKGFEKRRR